MSTGGALVLRRWRLCYGCFSEVKRKIEFQSSGWLVMVHAGVPVSAGCWKERVRCCSRALRNEIAMAELGSRSPILARDAPSGNGAQCRARQKHIQPRPGARVAEQSMFRGYSPLKCNFVAWFVCFLWCTLSDGRKRLRYRAGLWWKPGCPKAAKEG